MNISKISNVSYKSNLFLKNKSKSYQDNIYFNGSRYSCLKDSRIEKLMTTHNYDKILPYCGIEVEKDKDGMLILDHYCQPKGCKFSDLGINEDDLFTQVKEIKNYAYFRDSKLTSLGNLESIGKDANFGHGRLTSLGNLKTIGGYANFSHSKINSLENIEYIGGSAFFRNSGISSIPENVVIKGELYF